MEMKSSDHRDQEPTVETLPGSDIDPEVALQSMLSAWMLQLLDPMMNYYGYWPCVQLNKIK